MDDALHIAQTESVYCLSIRPFCHVPLMGSQFQVCTDVEILIVQILIKASEPVPLVVG